MGSVGVGEEPVEPVLRLRDVPDRLSREQQRDVEDERTLPAPDIEDLEPLPAVVDALGHLAARVIVRVRAEQDLRAADELI